MNNDPDTPEDETPEVEEEEANAPESKSSSPPAKSSDEPEGKEEEAETSAKADPKSEKKPKAEEESESEPGEKRPPKKKKAPKKKTEKKQKENEDDGKEEGGPGGKGDDGKESKTSKDQPEAGGEKKGNRTGDEKKKPAGDGGKKEGAGADEQKRSEEEAEKEKLPDIPDKIDLNEFQEKAMGELYDLGLELGGLRVAGARTKHHIIYEILSFYAKHGSEIRATGILEPGGGKNRESFGFLRWPKFNFAPLPDDVYVSAQLVRDYELRPGQLVSGILRPPRDRKDKFLALDDVDSIEGVSEEDFDIALPFEKLTALFPAERIILENADLKSVSTRVVDLVAPLGKGQRGLIVAPPRGGKTILLKEIARAIHANHEEVELIILLLDERPEEVTDFEEAVDAPVFSSTFDENAQRHAQVAELVMCRAQRLVEQKKDVVVLLDSITRLARGYNNTTSGKGRGVTSGGVSHQALEKSRKFFGAARNVEEGGSLTILATALVETESRMDDVIFEQFKGTGNMEIHLDRELVEKRIFPAIHTLKSGTRKDDLLYHPEEMSRVNQIRRQLSQLPVGEAMEVLTKNIKLTGSNAEILLTGLR